MMEPMRFSVIVLLTFAGCGPRVLYRAEAPELGGVVYVVERRDGVRALRFDRPDAEDQSLYDRSRPGHEPGGYIRTSLLALAYLERPVGGLLMVGLGGGSYLRHVESLAPRMPLEAVEISPLVVRICRRYFGCPSRARIHVGDGRQFIKRSRRHYQLVFIDAYDAKDYPRHLGTRQFFEEVRRLLAPGGVVVANLSPNTDTDRADLVHTFNQVFPAADCFRTHHDNSVMVGVMGRVPGFARVSRRVAALDRASGGRYQLRRVFSQRCQLDLAGARVLED